MVVVLVAATGYGASMTLGSRCRPTLVIGL